MITELLGFSLGILVGVAIDHRFAPKFRLKVGSVEAEAPTMEELLRLLSGDVSEKTLDCKEAL